MNNRALKILFFSLLIGTTVYLERPILPSILESYQIDVRWSGYLFASMSLAVMIFAPFWGDVGDVKGRKIVLLIALIGMSVAQYIFAISTSIFMMVISRFIFGTFFSAIAVSFMAFFNDNYENHVRSKMISYNLAIFILGLALGSLLGGFFSDFYVLKEVYFLQVFSFLILALMIFIFYPKETVHIDRKRQYIFNLIANIKRVNKTKLLPGMFITMTFAIGVQVTLNFLEFYLTINNYSVMDIGYYIFILSIIGAFGNFFITHRILQVLDEKIFLIIILVISGIALIVTFYLPILGLHVHMMLFALTHNMFKPITTQIISKNAGDIQGVALGVRETLIHLGLIVGSIIGGFIIGRNPDYIFLFSAVIMFVASIGFGVLRYIDIFKK